MKRRDFLKSSAMAVLGSNLNLSVETSKGPYGTRCNALNCGEEIAFKAGVGVMPTAAELLQAKQWFATNFSVSANVPPFSFAYDGRPSESFLSIWPETIHNQALDTNRTQRTIAWTDPNTKLEVRCVAIQYLDFPVVEWTVYFKNIGTQNTPILENIQGLNMHLERQAEGDFVLHHNRGDFDIPESYAPYSEILFQNVTETFSPVGGRPSNASFPYFNLQMPDGGLIAAIGWPGQWMVTFRRDEATGLHLTAGQEFTHLYLKPHEEIRTPLIVLLFWQTTDRQRAHNLWRRWMLAHTLPRSGGQLPSPIFSYCDGGFFPGLKVNEAGEKRSIDILTQKKVKLDYWWMDAGWYPCGDSWGNTGTWEPDPARFPEGLKAISDHVHAKGMKLLVWFEPERVTVGSELARNHPDWLLHDPEIKTSSSLLNLGRADVQEWLIAHIGGLIAEQGIDLYRQDFNMDPLSFWRKNDPSDRQGITENLHVQGLLAYWDALRQRFPNMLIDSCASGGRRIDLESMRRAVPLTRSDYSPFDGAFSSTTGNQGHTYGLSSWIPYYGQGAYIQPENTIYYARSYMCPAFAMPVNLGKQKVDWTLYHRLIDEWRHVADCMLGDYYPLTEYTLQNDQWIAWQFDCPEYNDGIIQVFRRDCSKQFSMILCMKGIDEASRYRIKNLDTAVCSTLLGRELLEDGLPVEIQSSPGSAILTYSRIVNRI